MGESNRRMNWWCDPRQLCAGCVVSRSDLFPCGNVLVGEARFRLTDIVFPSVGTRRVTDDNWTCSIFVSLGEMCTADGLVIFAGQTTTVDRWGGSIKALRYLAYVLTCRCSPGETHSAEREGRLSDHGATRDKRTAKLASPQHRSSAGDGGGVYPR